MHHQSSAGPGRCSSGSSQYDTPAYYDVRTTVWKSPTHSDCSRRTCSMGIQGLFIQIHRYIVTEDLFNERSCTDSPAADRSVVRFPKCCRRSPFLCIEDLAYIQCHLGFLVGLGDILQFLYHGTICHFSHPKDASAFIMATIVSGQFMQCLRCGGVFNRLDQDEAGLIHRCYIISRLRGKTCPSALQIQCHLSHPWSQ